MLGRAQCRARTKLVGRDACGADDKAQGNQRSTIRGRLDNGPGQRAAKVPLAFPQGCVLEQSANGGKCRIALNCHGRIDQPIAIRKFTRRAKNFVASNPWNPLSVQNCAAPIDLPRSQPKRLR